MHVGRMKSGLDWNALVTVRLLRRWAAARDELANPLPTLVELARQIDCPPEAAIALGSLFQLTESCLGRPLKAECCCSRTLSEDERAVLLMIAAAAGPGEPFALPEIPHGLPGALAWAASSVRRLLGSGVGPAVMLRTGRCPFPARPQTAIV